MVTFKDVKIDLQRQEKYRDYKNPGGCYICLLLLQIKDYLEQRCDVK